MKNIYFNTYKRVFRLLTKDFKKKFFGIKILILSSSVVDLLGLAVLIPIVIAVVDGSLVENNGLFLKIKDFIGITSNNKLLLFLFFLAFIFFIFRTVFILTSGWIQNRYIFSFGEFIGLKTYEYYLSLKYQDFQKKDSSEVIIELTRYNLYFSSFLMTPLLLLTNEFLVITFIICGIAFYNIEVFLLLMCTIFPVALLLNYVVKRKMKAYGEIQKELVPKIHYSSSRGILGFIDVILRRKESVLYDEYLTTLKKLNAGNIYANVLAISPAKIFELATVAGLLVIFVYAVFLTEDSNQTLSLLAIYVAAGYRVVPSLSKIISSLGQLQQYNFLLPIYEEILADAKPTIKPVEASSLMNFNESIKLEDIDFTFIESKIFDGLNLIINKGEIVGLIGKSGSGKTTLVNIISGFLTSSKGNLLIDGVKVNEENRRSWMSNISYVQQVPYIETGSLSFNIAFLEDNVDYERLNKAIKMASLEDFVGDRNPDEVRIEENGKNLSGGQKQRVVIARALYSQSKLIIMDEATSALDNETESEVNNTIQKLKGTGVTILIIAHRHTTLVHADKVFLVNEGRISETQINVS